MTPERWRQIENVFHAAMEREARARASFLDEACAGDETLRRDVETLLAANDQLDEQTDGFLDSPAMEVEAKTIAAEKESPIPGEMIAHYRVISRLGAGGMGEVWLARDTKLDRQVALKLLPPQVTEDAERLQRFTREAKAASALNHPNIITIYEIGEFGETRFIATEFIEGVTLRRLMSDEELGLREALDVAIQIAAALDAAHAAGIVHRDIKPENVMARPDGLVKVLDFGLAKLTAPPAEVIGADAPTLAQEMKTTPGMILGTLRYMSPEQARARDVDSRTDIFSLGAVLYEMITGQRLFVGETTADVIAAIINKEPEPLAEFTGESSLQGGELDRIVRKALAKDCRSRYQTARDLQIDLQALKQEIELSAQLLRSGRSGQPGLAAARSGGWAKDSSSNSGAHSLFKFSWGRVAGAAILVALIGAGAVWKFFVPSSSPAQNDLRIETIFGKRGQIGEQLKRSRFSPNGRMVAFAATGAATNDGYNIWVKQISSGREHQVTAGKWDDSSPAWSPDGEEIAFISHRSDHLAIWTVPFLGGQPKMIKSFEGTEIVTQAVIPVLEAWAKDGSAIFYEWNRNFYRLELATRQVAKLTRFDPVTEFPAEFSLSPDQQQVAYAIQLNGQMDIWRVGLRGGDPVRVTNDPAADRYPVWHPDGRRLIYNSMRDERWQIYQINLDGGEPALINTGESEWDVADFSANNYKLLCYDQRDESDIFVVNVKTGKERQVTSDLGAEFWSSISPDGKTLVYQSLPGEKFTFDPDKSLLVSYSISAARQSAQLAANAFLAQWASNGERLAFLRRSGQSVNLWTVGAGGGEEKQLTRSDIWRSGRRNSPPYDRLQVKDYCWSPDSARIAYCARDGGVFNIVAVTVDGSQTIKISDNNDPQALLFSPLWSPDGRRIVYGKGQGRQSPQGKARWSLWASSQGAPEMIFSTESAIRPLGWVSNDVLIVALAGGPNYTQLIDVNLLAISLSVAGQRQLGSVSNSYFYSFQLALDGRYICFVKAQTGSGDIWVAAIGSDRMSQPLKITNNVDPALFFSSLVWAPDGKAIYYDRQTRWDLLKTIDNLK